MRAPLIAMLTGAAVAGAIFVGAAQSARRTVYASVLDKDHVPIADMQAADFEVKEGGKTAEIISAKRATAPLRIAIIDSDAGTGAYQQGLLQFMQKLLDRAEFAITSVIVQPQKVTDFTSDTATLSKALDGLGKRGTMAGAQLMEAINDATKVVAAPGKRGVILVTRYGAEGTSSLSPKDVRDNLRKSGASLYVLSIKGMNRVQTAAPTNGAQPANAMSQQMDLRNDELNEGRFNLQLVLGDGARESGGRHDEIVAISLSKSVEAIADELLNQYEILYAVPAGVKPADKLSVTSKRKNVSVFAPNQRRLRKTMLHRFSLLPLLPPVS